MKKCFRFIKDYPIIWGILGACITVGVLVLYQIRENAQIVSAEHVNADMARTAALENTNSPELLTDVFLDGIQKQDLDKVLRCIAIEETVLKSDVRSIANRAGAFYTELAVAPSGFFEEYEDISSAELAGIYSAEIRKIWESFPDASGLKVVDVQVASPAVQAGTQFQSKSLQQLEDWGGECSLTLAVLLEYEEQNYILGLTLGHYKENKKNYWKVFSLDSELTETTEETPVREITPEQYDELTDDITVQEFLENLEKQNVEYDLYKEKTQEADIQNGLFELNYPVINPLKEDSPEKVIEAFFIGIEKQELLRSAGYCTSEGEEDLAQTTPGLLERQQETVTQVKRFCYGFMGCDYDKEHASLSEIGKTGTKIVEALDPKYFMYIDWSDMIPLEGTENEREYLVCFRYEGKHFMSGFTLKNEDGWRILSLSSETLGLESGEVRELTEKEYEKLLEKYQEGTK